MHGSSQKVIRTDLHAYTVNFSKLGMFMTATMNAATFSWKKNFMDNENSIKNSTDLTLKKMFDISEKLVSEQEEIHIFCPKIYWTNHSWKQLSLIGDETVINLQSTKSLRLLRFCVVSWKSPSTSNVQRSLEEKD